MAAAIRITPYRDADRPALLAFVAGIQDYERALAPQLKTGAEIAEDHADRVLSRVSEGSGVLLMAREENSPWASSPPGWRRTTIRCCRTPPASMP